MNNASLRSKDKYYPRQLFFKWRPRNEYVFDGWMDEKNFSNLYDQKNFTPVMLQEVMEYYTGCCDVSDCYIECDITDLM